MANEVPNKRANPNARLVRLIHPESGVDDLYPVPSDQIGILVVPRGDHLAYFARTGIREWGLMQYAYVARRPA